MTEHEVSKIAEEHALRLGASDFWTITNVGFGAGSLTCFPTQRPTERPLWSLDIGHVDVHPATSDGWWGDCTRTVVTGQVPEYLAMHERVRDVHRRLLDSIQPGMAAHDLYEVFATYCQRHNLAPLDRLHNIGHSLARANSYASGYIDAHNTTPMWGAWAIEPFFGNHLYGVKLEDVVWIGPEKCVLVR